MIAFYIESQQNTFSIFINAIPNIIMEINIDNSFHWFHWPWRYLVDQQVLLF